MTRFASPCVSILDALTKVAVWDKPWDFECKSEGLHFIIRVYERGATGSPIIQSWVRSISFPKTRIAHHAERAGLIVNGQVNHSAIKDGSYQLMADICEEVWLLGKLRKEGVIVRVRQRDELRE